MKRNTKSPKPLNESEREELIRLRAENAYIKAENAVIKQIALRRQNGLRSKRQKAAIIQELRQEGHPLKYLLKFSD